MKSVVLKQKSWHGLIYSQVYNESPKYEKNFCNYFWKVILALIFSPFIWVGAVTPRDWRDGGFWQSVITTVITYVALGFCFLIGTGIAEKYGWEDLSPYYFVPLGMGAMIVTIVAFMLIMLIVFGISCLWEKVFKKSKIKDSSEVGFFGGKIQSFKEKNCPIIQWKEEK